MRVPSTTPPPRSVSSFRALTAALLVATLAMAGARAQSVELAAVRSIAGFLNSTSWLPLRPTKPPGAELPCTTAPLMYPTVGYKPSIDMANRVVIITGASRGIGRALGLQLHALGATVIGTSRTPAAYTDLPYPLLTLDQADPASVDAFVAAVLAQPAVVARGGIDALVASAGRIVFGNVAPPIKDPTMYYDAMNLAVQTLYIGPVRVINGLLPAVEARANTSADAYGRVVVTVSPGGYAQGGVDMIDANITPYVSAKRGLLAAVNDLRGVLTFRKSKVKLSSVNPFVTNTTITDGLRPIFMQPVDSAGNAVDDPQFQAFLDFARADVKAAQPADLTAAAYVQVLTMHKPPPNVAAGSYKPQPRVRGSVDTIRVVFDAENAQSAFPYVAGGPSGAAAGQAVVDADVASKEVVAAVFRP